MKAVIMAGGKGTRLSPITGGEIPKPMVKLDGKPILEHQLAALKKNGINQITIIAGYLHEKIQDYFGHGSAYGVKINYIIEDEPLGTAGALFYLKNSFKEDFLLLFGDILFDVSIARMAEQHRRTGAKATLFVHPNTHPYDSDLVVLDESYRVVGYAGKNQRRDYFYANLVNAGIYMLNPVLLKKLDRPVKRDLEKDLLFPQGKPIQGLYGYISPEYAKDLGTPERLKLAELDLINGIVSARNLDKPQKCIFLDRDGTLNKHVGLLYKTEQLELEDGAAEAIRLINRSGHLAIVITNQPVVARNLCSIDELQYIHNKMETLLGEQEAYLDAILFCPHHPDQGYPEENPLFKIKCNCRKPMTGLIEQCQDRFHIDCSQSWFIGDTTVDIQLGINAGLRTVLVKTGLAGTDGKFNVTADLECANLLEAVHKILGVG
jgi:mannose-1-phosphate guanylyltransferase/phosphomannomutase